MVLATIEHAHELEALGVAPMAAFRIILQGCTRAWTWLHDWHAVAMFGVSDALIARTGMPWVYASRSAGEHRVAFLRESRYWLAIFLAKTRLGLRETVYHKHSGGLTLEQLVQQADAGRPRRSAR